MITSIFSSSDLLTKDKLCVQRITDPKMASRLATLVTNVFSSIDLVQDCEEDFESRLKSYTNCFNGAQYHKDRRVFGLASGNGTLIGFADWELYRKYAILERFGIDQNFRGQDLGTLLFEESLAQLRIERSYLTSVHLDACRLASTLAFYKKLGFVTCEGDEFDVNVEESVDSEETISLRKKLTVPGIF